MNAQYQYDPIQPAGLLTLGQLQARRRQLLGLLLLGVGSGWFYLRVTGQVGSRPFQSAGWKGLLPS